MPDLWFGLIVGALAAAAIAAPLFGPWRFRVRLLATAPMTDPFTGLGLTPRPDMRVVRLLALESRDGDVEITVEETDTHRSSHISLVRAGCAPGAVAKLDAWLALGTPLLLMTDLGHIHVFGPDGAINDLSRIGAKVR
jgi:hypothetical protein